VTGKATGVTAAVGLLVVGPVLGLTVLVAATPPASAAQTSGAMKAGAVPAAYLEAVTKAGGECPAVSGPLIAAQIETESGWNPTAVSPKGAEGLSQFLPGTWASRGIDANRDGTADPFDPLDAIASQAGYDCALAGAVAAVPGDRVGNMLAAYNAGPVRSWPPAGYRRTPRPSATSGRSRRSSLSTARHRWRCRPGPRARSCPPPRRCSASPTSGAAPLLGVGSTVRG